MRSQSLSAYFSANPSNKPIAARQVRVLFT